MRLRTRLSAAATCLLLILTSQSAARPDVTWAGPPGGAWSLADNWDPMQVPNNAGSILFDATVNADGPLVDGAFSVRALTVNDQVLITSGNLGFSLGTLAVGNTFLSGNGMISIQPGMNQNPTTFVVQGGTTLTISGNGSILMGGPGTARILGGPGGTLNNTSWRIIGEGNLAEGFMHVRNNGTITASGGSLILNAAGYTNTGLLSALPGSILRINGSFGTMSNAGSILADGGIVQLAQGLQIDGGTLTTTNGGLIATATGGISTIRLTAVTNTGHFLSLGGTNTDIEQTIDNRGSFTIERNLRVAGAATLSGGGTVILQPLSELKTAGVASSTLINTSNTIRGSGAIGLGTLRIVNEPDATIAVENGGSMTIWPSAAGLRNTGTISVGQSADGTGTLIFSGQSGGTFDNRSGVIRMRGDTRLLLTNGTVISGGTISATGPGIIKVLAGHVAALNGDVFWNGNRLDVDGILRVANAFDGSGTFAIAAGAGVHVDGSATFGFGHTPNPG